jgi:hypothetical protein
MKSDHIIESRNDLVNSIKCLNNIFKKNNWIVGGGFTFFFQNKNGEDGKLWMRFSNLNKDTFERNLHALLDSENDRNFIRNVITKNRPFKSTIHGSQKSNYDLNKFSHFKVPIPIKRVLKIVETINDENEHNLTIEEVNELDALFFNFPENQTVLNVLKIPIPFLSTPSALLVINDNFQSDSARAKLINDVFLQTREPIYNYVYNSLITSLLDSIQSKIITNYETLVQIFIDELCKVLLPNNYRILITPSPPFKSYISQWQVKDNDSVFTFRLKLTGGCSNYCITEFELTSFHFPEFTEANYQSKSQKHPTKWIHQLDRFKQNASQVKKMLESIFNLIYEQWKKQQELKHFASRAAISQVMARNMSHNIGSHVLSRLATRDKVSTINDESTKQCLTLGLEEKDRLSDYHSIETILNSLPSIEDKPNPVITDIQNKSYLIANFNSYLRTRMDYLADITTCTPVIENTKNFYSDIMTEFLSNKTLLNRISGVSAEKQFKIYTCYIYNSDVCSENVDTCNYTLEKPGRKDIRVSVPNDVLGCHAFYVILENIIRNTFKHSSVNQDFVNFFIKIKDYDDLYQVEIFDKSENANIDKDVEDINKRIEESILDNSSRLRPGGLGVIEMKASAAYLRKVPIETIETKATNINPPVLQAYIEQNHFLGYRFYFLKPKEFLILGEDNDIFPDEIAQNREITSSVKNNFKKHGIWVINPDLENQIYPHKIVVDLRSDKKFDQNNSGRFTWRKLTKINSEKFKADIFSMNFETLQNNIFHEFCSQYFHDYSNQNLNGYLDKVGEFKASTSHSLLEKYLYLLQNSKENFFEVLGSETGKFENKWQSFSTGFDVYMRESRLIRVLVIDERIQQFSDTGKYNNIPIKLLYESTGIIVPSQDNINLNKQSFSENFNEILTYIADQSENFDFCVFHLGIIEKIMKCYASKEGYDKNSKESVTKFILDKICEDGQTSYDSIVLTSGRGVPDNLPMDIRFLNFSIVSQYLVELRNKFAFTQAIFSARQIDKTY